MGDGTTSDTPTYEESQPPCIDVTLGEVSIYVQGTSRETLDEITDEFEALYEDALEDYRDLTDHDDDAKGWG